MTAYELASLHAQIGETVNAQLANWLAILSVYLGAGYLVAHRLSLPSAIAVSVIAGATLTLFAQVIRQALGSLAGVSAEIQKMSLHGGGLEWHQATRMSAFAIEWLPTNSFISLLVITVFAIYFFFSARHQNRKATQSAPKTDAASATTD